jgi:hypothetical protein
VINRATLDEYIAKQGPYLYHRAPAEALPKIAHQGLLPWDDDHREDWPDDWAESQTTTYADSRMTPRSDHTYLGSSTYVGLRYGGIWLKVDLRRLDPLLIDSDEDHYDRDKKIDMPKKIAVRLDEVPREWGSVEEYAAPVCEACDGEGVDANGSDCPECLGYECNRYASPYDEESLGEWADRQSDILDSPEAVAYSLRQGSISIRGGVPAQAIELDYGLLRPNLDAIAEVFADYELEIKPFYAGEGYQVSVDRLGQILTPAEAILASAGWLRTEIVERIERERCHMVIDMFNSGALRTPTLSGVDKTLPVAVGEPLTASGLSL